MSDALYEQYPAVYDALYAEKHVHDLVDAPTEVIAETLEARGLETEIVEGYGASGEWPATVVVANYGKS